MIVAIAAVAYVVVGLAIVFGLCRDAAAARAPGNDILRNLVAEPPPVGNNPEAELPELAALFALSYPTVEAQRS